MAYEFKKLSDVAAVETPADTANVLIEEDGVIKKVANFAQSILNKITRADVVEELSDESYVLVEEGGSVKRVPKTSVGGSSEQSEQLDLIIKIEGDINELTRENCSVISGDIEKILDKFENRENVTVQVQFQDDSEWYPSRAVVPASITLYGMYCYVFFTCITGWHDGNFNVYKGCITINTRIGDDRVLYISNIKVESLS